MKRLTLEVLEDARALLTKGWCQGALAQDSLGRALDSREDRACRWCLSGAIGRATFFRAGVSEGDAADRAADVIVLALRERSDFAHAASINTHDYCRIVEWNDEDGRKWQDVLSLMDRAVEIAQKEVTP